MSEQFERFAKMAKEKYGIVVESHPGQQRYSFQSLYGVSLEDLVAYEPHCTKQIVATPTVSGEIGNEILREMR